MTARMPVLVAARAVGMSARTGSLTQHAVDDLRTKAQFVRITGAGLRESHVHDVTITREAPNYKAG